MAILYAYGYKPKPKNIRTDLSLADLSGVGNGPDLFDIVEAALHHTGTTYEVPPAPTGAGHEDTRQKYLRFEPTDITADHAERLIYGRAWMFRKGEAERKTKLETNRTTQYADDDPGDRPLFFLFSLPKHATEALVILESARPYGMTTFWRTDIRTRFNQHIPSGVHPVQRGNKTVDKDVILEFRPYGALDTPDFIEQFSDGTINEAAAMRTEHPGGKDGPTEARMVHVERDQSVDRSRLADLVRRKRKDDVARMLIPTGMVDGLGGDPEEVKFRGKFHGRDKTILMSRSSVSQPGIEVPRDSPKDPFYVEVDTLRTLAAELAETVGHDHAWE